MTAQIKFYLDTHIPKAVATQLRQQGVEAIRCEEVNLAEADDIEHLEYATAHQLTLVSHDRDFWAIHTQWLAQNLKHTGIILFHRQFQGNVGKLVAELAFIHESMLAGAGNPENDIYNRVYHVER